MVRGIHVALRRFAADRRAATAIEYGLITGLVALGAIMAISQFGGSVDGMFNRVETAATQAFDWPAE